MQGHVTHGICTALDKCENANKGEKINQLKIIEGYIDKMHDELQVYLNNPTGYIASASNHANKLETAKHILQEIKDKVKDLRDDTKIEGKNIKEELKHWWDKNKTLRHKLLKIGIPAGIATGISVGITVALIALVSVISAIIVTVIMPAIIGAI